ncbi:hypothetical protein, partial [Staphylococcus aureus]|uniref:hypothetical protein n=1 Tax=Staphylococcus aureus TaxID=1280 RepID=UPI001C930ABC
GCGVKRLIKIFLGGIAVNKVVGGMRGGSAGVGGNCLGGLIGVKIGKYGKIPCLMRLNSVISWVMEGGEI